MNAITFRINSYLAILIVAVTASGASLLILHIANDETAFFAQYEEIRQFK